MGCGLWEENQAVRSDGLDLQSTAYGPQPSSLHLNHVEFFFAGAAIGAAPGQRHIFPLGAGWNARHRITLFFFVDIAANYTQIGFHLPTTQLGSLFKVAAIKPGTRLPSN